MGIMFMKKVIIILASGFEEIETITVANILRRSGARVILAGLDSGPIEGSRGIKLVPDSLLDSVISENFDLIILPGGQPGTDNLLKDTRVSILLKEMNQKKKLIGAICAAPLVLEANGLLEKVKRTSHPSVKKYLSGELYLEKRVVVDKNIITSRAPGTALEFSLRLIEILFNKSRVLQISKVILAKN